MEYLIKFLKKQKLAKISIVVISNKADAKGLLTAQKLGIPTEIVESEGYKGPNWEYDKKIISALDKHNLDPENGLICLAGFMRILSPEFIRIFKGKILNIHPALLPSFPGLHAQRQAIDYGVKFSGCTVHLVDEGMDTGPIILQAVVPLKKNDTEEKLARRIQEKEHMIYPMAVSLFLEKRIKPKGRDVEILSKNLVRQKSR